MRVSGCVYDISAAAAALHLLGDLQAAGGVLVDAEGVEDLVDHVELRHVPLRLDRVEEALADEDAGGAAGGEELGLVALAEGAVSAVEEGDLRDVLVGLEGEGREVLEGRASLGVLEVREDLAALGGLEAAHGPLARHVHHPGLVAPEGPYPVLAFRGSGDGENGEEGEAGGDRFGPARLAHCRLPSRGGRFRLPPPCANPRRERGLRKCEADLKDSLCREETGGYGRGASTSSSGRGSGSARRRAPARGPSSPRRGAGGRSRPRCRGTAPRSWLPGWRKSPRRTSGSTAARAG